MQLRVGINNVQKRRKTSVSLRANLVGASLTGLVVGYVLWMESVSSYEPIYRFKDYAAKAGIAIASYIAATYLVHLVFLRRLAVRNLRWALIALTGSILIVGYALLVHYTVMAIRPEAWAFELKQPISKIIRQEATGALGFSLIFISLYTITALPIMAVIHYGARMLFLSRSEA